jgi:hypothetical protein
MLGALGVVALLAGGAMVLAHFHHTVGYGVLAGGGLLILIGIITALGTKRPVSTTGHVTPNMARQRPGIRKMILAAALIVVVGAGTFYGVNYLANTQSGGSGSSASSSTLQSSSYRTDTTAGENLSTTSSGTVTVPSSPTTSVRGLVVARSNFSGLGLSLGDLFGNFSQMKVTYTGNSSSWSMSYTVVGKSIINSAQATEVNLTEARLGTPLSPPGKSSTAIVWFDSAGSPLLARSGGKNYTGQAAMTLGNNFTAPLRSSLFYLRVMLDNSSVFPHLQALALNVVKYGSVQVQLFRYSVSGTLAISPGFDLYGAQLQVGTLLSTQAPANLEILTSMSVQSSRESFTLFLVSVTM